MNDKIIMPIQPIETDEHGTLRFIPNRIVEKLLEVAPIGLNEIACMDFTAEERRQFAQLIGYSLGGYDELSYVNDESYEAAYEMTEGISELEARNKYLREKIESVKEALKDGIAVLLEIHPDDIAG